MTETDLPLTNTAEKPRLSEVLDYGREIAPYPLTMIYAGLGSGKNTLAGHLMTGCKEHNIPKKNVLLITSRKAKVVETLCDKNIDIGTGIGDKRSLKDIMGGAPFGIDVYRREIENDPRGWGNIIQRSTACTNAFIEKYHQYVYDPNDPSTHLWNRFDVIIVDEVHALVTDSTFQSSPYHTYALVKETVNRINAYRSNEEKSPEERDPDINKPVCQNVILMTGTPEAVRHFEKIRWLRLVDKMDECRNVAPRNLHLIMKEDAVPQIKAQLAAGERLIYFANHITPVDELAKIYGIPRERIAMQFSDETRLKEMKRASEKQKADAAKKGSECPETDYDKLNDIQDKLAKDSLIREDIQLFVTTSKNKEGININNKDIHHVYIEAHSLTDIRQMAGRVREGAEHAYVIADAEGHHSREHWMERWLDIQMCQHNLSWDSDDFEENIHSQADSLVGLKCAENGVWNLVGNPKSKQRAFCDDYPAVGECITLIKNKHPYLQYNFLTNRFCYNILRERGVGFVKKELEDFKAALMTDEDFLRIFSAGFPETALHPIVSKIKRAELYLQQVRDEHLDNRYTTEEKEKLSKDLDLILCDEKKRKKRKGDKPQPNRALHQLGYEIIQVQRKEKGCKGYDAWKIIPYPSKVEAA